MLSLCMSKVVCLLYIAPTAAEDWSLLQAKQAQLPHPHNLQPPDQLTGPPV